MEMVAYKQSQNSRLDYFAELFLKLRNGHYFGRLGKCFKTDKNFYFIDAGTGKIAKIKEHVYLVLKTLLENDSFNLLHELEMTEEELIDALNTIEKAVEGEHILSAPIVEIMGKTMMEDLDELLLNHVMSLTLEVTEECNLRCKYCIYHPAHPNFREFGKKHMSLEIAKQAIDFLKQHSSKNDEVTYIGFYGGEPLLNFEVVKGSVNYAQEVFRDRTLQFNLTTNATLLTQPISDYLVENKVTLTLSLDGPKEIHDENRVASDGQGSFDKAIQGIKHVLHSFEKFNQTPHFTLNMVTASSDFEKRYDLIQEFFETCDWWTEDIQVMCNGIDMGPQKMDYILPQSEEEKCHSADLIDALGVWSDARNKDYKKYEKTFSKRSIDQELVKLHKRSLTKEPDANYFMNGCCVPGQKRGYVAVNGDIFPCERVGTHIPPLGNVKAGWDIASIKRYYLYDYVEKSKTVCKNCWAVNLCGLCYVNCYNEGGLDLSNKHALCVSERLQIEASLVRYHTIFENNPDVIQAFNETEIV